MKSPVRSATLAAALFTGQLAAATLEGYASLPAETLAPGPPAGRFAEPAHGIALQLEGQPVQGFSAVLSNGDGTFLALTDNGFGNRSNSGDFLLRIYRIVPDFRTSQGGTGEIRVGGFVGLRESRPLSGADYDPESMQRATDGTFWIGEEFGPWLLHFDAGGELLEAPYSLDGLVAQPRPGATLPRSRGFEGMAISPRGDLLYPMLEGALSGQAGQLNIYTFDLRRRAFHNPSATEPSYRYRLEPRATAIGAFTLFGDSDGLVLERDSEEGARAAHKKVYRVDFTRLDQDGFLAKEEVADLLAISDPQDLDGDGQTTFTFPFDTPEGLLVVDRDTIGVINDNNYPFGRGRGPGPEDTEFILLEVDPLW